jgi:hypothetical protein
MTCNTRACVPRPSPFGTDDLIVRIEGEVALRTVCDCGIGKSCVGEGSQIPKMNHSFAAQPVAVHGILDGRQNSG